MTILFAYDGSEGADAAIAAAGKLLDQTAQMLSSSPSGNRLSSKRYAQTDSAAGLQSHQTSLG